jgi:flagellar biogenesis protein FliO
VNPAVPGTGLLLVKLALSLGLVVGLILVLQKAARKWGHALGAGGGPEAIRLLSQRSVGPRLSLAVVEVRGRTLLVGISPQGIHAVADLDASSPPGVVPRAQDQAPPRSAPSTSFGSLPHPIGHGLASSSSASIPAVGAAVGAGMGVAAVAEAVAEAVAVGPHPAAATPARGFLERWGLRSCGASSFAPTSGHPAGPPRGGTAGGSALRRGSAPSAVFEDELLARLASLRDRYPSLADLEADAAEAWR